MNFFFFIPLSFAATKERGKEKWLLRRHECHPLCPPSNSCGKSKLDADTLLHAAIGGRPFTSRPHRMSALPAHIRQWADVVMSLHVAIVYRPQVCGSRQPRVRCVAPTLWGRGMHTITESRQRFHICRNGNCHASRSRRGLDLRRSHECAAAKRCRCDMSFFINI